MCCQTNESFNGMIWERVPKTHYVSLTHLEFGVYDAVANLNMGMKSSVQIYEKLQMIPGAFTLRGCKSLNARRLWFAQYKAKQQNKVRRQLSRGKKLEKNDSLIESGPILYEPGGF